MATNSIVESLIGDLLEWIGPNARPYAEVQEAWRTSCPRLPVWEDAVDAQYLEIWRNPEGVRMITVSASGRSFLKQLRDTRNVGVE